MFISSNEFVEAVLETNLRISVVTWESRDSLEWFCAELKERFEASADRIELSVLDAENLDSRGFEEAICAVLDSDSASSTCLTIKNIEPLTSLAVEIMNGLRERLINLRALIILIRANRKRDLLLSCPDLMDWVGPNLFRAEDLGPPVPDEVVESLWNKE
jgi:hypothetical protein